jgi:uncharacterized membrane protein
VYFSFVVDITFQVSDVQIEDHSLRRGVLAHGVLAFFFDVIVHGADDQHRRRADLSRVDLTVSA